MERGEIVGGRFRVDEEVGFGGMGTVYRAFDLEEKRHVALKELRSILTQDALRFSREAEVLRSLSHPGVVAYFGHGKTDQGTDWLAMEWLAGSDLGTILGKGQMSPNAAVKMVKNVASALAAVHAAGIVHRDIKPSNLFLQETETGQVARVLDFGVAHVDDPDVDLTSTGVVIGSIGYLSPEQARGDNNAVTAKSDVFALGAVFYECLVGVPSFLSSTVMGTMARILFEPVPQLNERRPDLHPNLGALLNGMLSKEPQERPSMREVEQSLAELAEIFVEKRTVANTKLTNAEKQVVAVMVGRVMEKSEALAANYRPQLRARADSLGMNLEFLRDGSLVAMASATSSPRLQVYAAARLALATRAYSPSLRMVVGLGRGVIGREGIVGEAVDTALRRAQDVRVGDIAADPMAAGLLEQDFVLFHDHDISRLTGERDPDAPASYTNSTPLFGRDALVEEVVGRAQQAFSTQSTQSELIYGASGMGKTRMLIACRESLRGAIETMGVVELRGNATSSHTPFASIGPAIRRVLGISDRDIRSTRIAKLRDRVNSIALADAPRLGRVLGHMADIPVPDDVWPEFTILSAKENSLQKVCIEALADWLRAESSYQPILILVDDAHLLDSSTAQVLGGMRSRLNRSPVYLLATLQSGSHQGLGNPLFFDATQETPLPLLTRSAVFDFVTSSLPEHAANVHDNIVLHAGGNPYFANELIRAAKLGDLDKLPDTVVGTVAAKLHSVPPEGRLVLRGASVAGMKFWGGLLHSMLGGASPAWLAKLEIDGFVTRQRTSKYPDEVEYRFRDQLLRDACYSTLTDEDKSLAHGSVADWLSQRGESSDVIAKHYDAGGRFPSAILAYARAAQEALVTDNLDSAIRFARRGNALGARSDTAARLHLVEGECQFWRAEPNLSRQSAAAAMGEAQRFDNNWYLAVSLLAKSCSQINRIEGLGPIPETVAQRTEMDEARILALSDCALALTHLGAEGRASLCVRHALSGLHELGEASAHTTGMVQMALARYTAHSGEVAPSIAAYERANEFFEEATMFRTMTMSLSHMGLLLVDSGSYEEAARVCRRALKVCRRMGFASSLGLARYATGRALLRIDQSDASLRQLRKAIPLLSQLGDTRIESEATAALAETILETGDSLTALKTAQRAVGLAAQGPALAQALTVFAQVLASQDRWSEAMVASERALQSAKQHSMSERQTQLWSIYSLALTHCGRKADAVRVAQMAKAQVLRHVSLLGEPRAKMYRDVSANRTLLSFI